MRELKALLADQLPSLRRYAAAFTGSSERGDRYVCAAIEAVLAEPGLLANAADFRTEAFSLLHRLFALVAMPESTEPTVDQSTVAQQPLAQLTAEQRAALLLVSLESFTYEQAARVIGVNGAKLCLLLREARHRLGDGRARVLIVEDEPLVALDLERIVRRMGHEVCGIAANRSEALRAAMRSRPHLMLADVRLKDGADGIATARDIRAYLGLHVIFVTAYGDELATLDDGAAVSVVSKPFAESAIRNAVRSALVGQPQRTGAA